MIHRLKLELYISEQRGHISRCYVRCAWQFHLYVARFVELIAKQLHVDIHNL